MQRSIITLDNGDLLFGWGDIIPLAEPGDGPAWFSSDFFLLTPGWYTHPHYTIVKSIPLPLAKKLEAIKWKSPKPFKVWFDEVFELFKGQTLKKAVPYTYQEGEGKIIPAVLLQELFKKGKELFIYGTWNDKKGFIGATPEMLIEVNGKKALSHALASTAHDTEKLKEIKEKEEHEWVVKSIIHALTPFGPVKIQPQKTVKFHNLYHLLTPIELTLSHPHSHTTLIEALHPTSALGAFPKQEGTSLLKKWDQESPRGSYGSPFAYSYQNKMRAYVAIRNIQWEDLTIKLFAGAGVTQASTYESEWDEVCAKIENTKALFGI